jgi:WXG100 family type VII secretion target
VAGNQVSVATSGMTQAASLFEDAASQLTNQLHSIDSEMDLLRVSWGGDSATRFFSAMADWENEFGTIIGQLAHMVEVMGGNASAYDQGAQEATAEAARLDGLAGL